MKIPIRFLGIFRIAWLLLSREMNKTNSLEWDDDFLLKIQDPAYD